MHDSLSTNDLFSTVRQIIRFIPHSVLWLTVRIATMEHTDQERSALKLKNYLKVTLSAQFDPVS